ncbi:outer membrane protein assembly factor BamD [Kaistia hirudinis]|uniref:Outer membrane protein assembly factor BamD n=1 Tax=Kaistia hirudinis TaxID=1293440 RepID=A0A840AUR2_9HYPH|nr:outer membrane protein assembly factor BamD [Kaistia hirudinis]MBB3932908.1 outer membrane protein assembly factor BamD [Kaistia hirudinis]MBN9019531.1 outer membrane protein assembly factor BamD [Hyphomicrobiales bacterium]
MNDAGIDLPAKLNTLGRASSVALRAALIVCMITLAGCSSFGNIFGEKDKPEEPDVPAGELYNQALFLMQEGKLRQAVKRFDEVDKQHPYTEWARKALIMSAFSNYRLGRYDDCIESAKRYLSLYPSSKDAAYAQYMIGQSYFKQIPDVTRDQESTQRALDAMQLVIDRYPDSEYVDDAQKDILVARDQLAGKEMQIGRYYLERKEYAAAINRFKIVVQEYANTRQVEEALYRLTAAYYAMGIVPEAQTAAAVLGHNFPDSPWYKDAYKLLQEGGVSPQENKGSWISKAFSLVTG